MRLSLGGSHSWHRIETKRELQYNEVSDRQKSKRDAQSTQVFGEAAWKVAVPGMALEPFANLAYVHIASDSFKEHGGAAALEGGRDNRDAWLSTLGMRAGKQLQLSSGQAVELSATLGWQHNLSSTGSDQHLAFAGHPEHEKCAEFGVSVLKKARGCGYGSRLFDRAVLQARSKGVSLMFIHALSENTAMLKIARNAGATVKRDGSESEAYLELPPANFETHVSSLMTEHIGEVDYQLKKQARNFWSFLAGVQEVRKGVQEGRHQSGE